MGRKRRIFTEKFKGKVEREQVQGILNQSFGAWRCDESTQETVEAARAAFRGSFERSS